MRLSEEEKAGLQKEIEEHGFRVRAIPREIDKLQMDIDSLKIEQGYVGSEMTAKCMRLLSLEVGGTYRVYQHCEAVKSGFNMILGTLKGVNNCGDLLFNKPNIRAVELGDRVCSRTYPYDELPACMFNGDHAPLVHMGHQSSWDAPCDYYAPTCPLCGYHEKPAIT